MKPAPQQLSYQHALSLARAALRRHSDSADLDALILLEQVTGHRREWLMAHGRERIEDLIYTQYQDSIEQRQRGVPVAYILGEKEFWSRSFIVSPAVLIPRPETELLIEEAIAHIQSSGARKILDLGTGSGCIAITIACENPNAQVTAVDNDADALEIARRNSARHQSGNIKFVLSDWFEKLDGERFDLIISNPPYIDVNDPHVDSSTRKYEPHSALFSTNNGLAHIERLIAQAGDFLQPGGKLLLEHGWQQGGQVNELLQQYGFLDIFSSKDLAGQFRVSGGTIS